MYARMVHSSSSPSTSSTLGCLLDSTGVGGSTTVSGTLAFALPLPSPFATSVALSDGTEDGASAPRFDGKLHVGVTAVGGGGMFVSTSTGLPTAGLGRDLGFEFVGVSSLEPVADDVPFVGAEVVGGLGGGGKGLCACAEGEACADAPLP
jgi:hypothetical protein